MATLLNRFYLFFYMQAGGHLWRRYPVTLLLTWTWCRQGTQGPRAACGNRPPGGPVVGSGSGRPCGGGQAGLLPGEGWPHAALAGQLQDGDAPVPLDAWV